MSEVTTEYAVTEEQMQKLADADAASAWARTRTRFSPT